MRLFSKRVMRGKQDAASETRGGLFSGWQRGGGLPLPSSTVNTVKTDAERKQGQKWQEKKKEGKMCFFLLAPLNTQHLPQRRPIRVRASELAGQWEGGT